MAGKGREEVGFPDFFCFVFSSDWRENLVPLCDLPGCSLWTARKGKFRVTPCLLYHQCIISLIFTQERRKVFCKSIYVIYQFTVELRLVEGASMLRHVINTNKSFTDEVPSLNKNEPPRAPDKNPHSTDDSNHTLRMEGKKDTAHSRILSHARTQGKRKSWKARGSSAVRTRGERVQKRADSAALDSNDPPTATSPARVTGWALMKLLHCDRRLRPFDLDGRLGRSDAGPERSCAASCPPPLPLSFYISHFLLLEILLF